MDLLKEDLVNYWYVWVLALLVIGLIAFGAGADGVFQKKTTMKCILPMLCVELAIAAFLMLHIIEWIGMGASFRWAIYEHALKIYLTVIALVCIPFGYLAGMIFARRKA